MKKFRLKRKYREWLFGYLFIGFWIIGFIVFSLIPMGQSIYYSTKNIRISTDGLQVVQNVGLKNYQNAFFFIYFMESLWDYAKNTLIMIPMIIVFSIIIALLLNRKYRLRGLFRTIYFLPVIISSGPVISRFQSQGAMKIPTLADQNLISIFESGLPTSFAGILATLFGRIVIIMWFTGVPVLIFLAGLQKIDQSIYEAASIDGASMWECFWKITLPTLKPLINVNIIFSIVAINIFSSNNVNSIIDSRKLTQYGYVNAMAWIYFVVTLLVLGILLLVVNFRRKEKRAVVRKVIR